MFELITEADWENCTDLDSAYYCALPRISGRKVRLFEVACCRRLLPHLILPASRDALDQLERFADDPPPETEAKAVTAAARGAADSLYDHGWVTGATVHWLAASAVVGVADVYRGAVLNAAAHAVWILNRNPPTTDPEQFEWDLDKGEDKVQLELLRDIFGNPFRPVALDPSWRTSAVVAVARRMYEARDFDPMPHLADALQDAGCEVGAVLDHCRGPGPHARGCWVVDGVLGRA